MSGARSLVSDAAGDDRKKIEAALERFDWRVASTLEEFTLGYDALFAEFEHTDDILPRAILRRWFDAGSLSPRDARIQCTFAMVLAFERSTGAFAGVRDCFVTTDGTAGRTVVLLAHTLVMPPFRRSGVAAILRTVPVLLAPEGELLLAGEMDMAVPDPKGTVIRLLAYARAGFAVIPPAALPYAQPDLRDFKALDVEAEPLPFLCLVRQVGEADAPTISRARARAFVEHIDAVHRCHMDGAQLDAIRDHALAALELAPDPIELLRLPGDTAHLAALRPLLKSVAFRLYPEPWRGHSPLADPDEEMRALLAAWRA